MFKNVGAKIKGVVVFFFVLGVIGCIAGAIVMFCAAYGPGLVVGGICLLLLGPVVLWMASLAMYGFGDLIECVQSIESKMGNAGIAEKPGTSWEKQDNGAYTGKNEKSEVKAEDKYREKLKKMLDDGSVTKEDLKKWFFDGVISREDYNFVIGEEK